jgi:hypothetical protein
LLLLACGAMPAAVALGNSLARRSINRVSGPAASSGSDDAAGSRAPRRG